MSWSFIPPLWRELRLPLEAGALSSDPVRMGDGVPRGDGQPVLLIPGYLAGDATLTPMASWLRRIGYRASRAGMLLNADCTTAALARLETGLDRRAERLGRPVVIIGHSRGGCFARVLATRRPDLVSGIVTLGSPLRDPMAIHPLARANVAVVGRLGSLGLPRTFSSACLVGACCADVREEAYAAFPAGVGFVSVFSRSDGIVAWRACLDPAARHVEVHSTHLGMAVHRQVYRAVAAALAEFGETTPAALWPAA